MSKIITTEKYDHRRKYYMVLDCETATLPIASDYPADQKKKIAIAKPLIYDLGWQIIDKKGNVYARKNFLVTEIFSVPEIFNTAYYASKRPIYIQKLRNHEIILSTWLQATEELEKDLHSVEAVGAYNSMFDFKKAIPFTERYISHLYSDDFQKWVAKQNTICNGIALGTIPTTPKGFDPDVFTYRGEDFPLFDLWGLSCKHILDDDEYRTACIKGGWKTESGKYFKTSAETTFRFVTGEDDFDEAHTAVDDAEIESEIFAKIMKKSKNKVEIGIEYFPFRILGTVESFLVDHPELVSYI